MSRTTKDYVKNYSENNKPYPVGTMICGKWNIGTERENLVLGMIVGHSSGSRYYQIEWYFEKGTMVQGGYVEETVELFILNYHELKNKI